MRSAIFASAALLTCSVLINATFADDKPSVPPQADAIQIGINAKEIEVEGNKVKGAELVVQGKSLIIPFEIEELTKLLGPGSRVSKEFQGKDGKPLPLKNWITTWDDFGIIAYCKPNTTKVTSVAACYAKKTFVFSPKQLYSGKLTLDGAEIKVTSTYEQINEAKKETKLKEKIPGFPWSIDYEGALITVGLEYVDGKPTDKLDQVAISWKEPKEKK